MPNDTTTLQITDYVLRRLQKPMDTSALFWPILFACVLLLFIAFLPKDNRSVYRKFMHLAAWPALGWLIVFGCALAAFLLFSSVEDKVALTLLELTGWFTLCWVFAAVFGLLLTLLLWLVDNNVMLLVIGGSALLVASFVFLVVGNIMAAWWSWWLLVMPVLAVGTAYLTLMYARDCHSISVPWAVLLAHLRLTVYVALAWCFMLPAMTQYDVTITESKVLVLFDVSGSIDATDAAASKSRLEHVVDFLEKPYVKGQGTKTKTFIEHLQDVAPVMCYRFGGIDDYEPVEFKGGQRWSAEEWRRWLEMKADKNKEPTPLADPFFAAKKLRGQDWLTEDDRLEAEKRRRLFDDHVKAIKNSTDIGGSIKKVLEREANSRIQAVIVFSDGKSNVPDQAALDEVVRFSNEKGKSFHIITVGVGDYKPVKKLEVDPLIAPTDRRVDDKKLQVHVPFTGNGLSNKEFEVYLYAKRVKDDRDKELANPQTYLVGYEKSVFGGGPSPSHESALQVIIANLHPTAAKSIQKKLAQERATTVPTVKSKDKDKEREGDESIPTLEDDKKKDVLGEWEFVAEVRVLNDDVIKARRGYFTTIEKVQINEAPIRVLLFSSGPSRDYQFVKGVFSREVQQKRAELSIYLQSAKDEQTEVTEDADGIIMLPDFPTRLDVLKKGDKSGKRGDPMNLKSYDVIIAFDADWEQLVPIVKTGAKNNQLELLREWVAGEHRGGLIFVSGPQHTTRLIPPPDPEKFKAWPLKPVFDLMPVILKRPTPNLKLETIHDSTIPYQLNFTNEAKVYDFLQLNPKGLGPTAGWEEFFGRPVTEEFADGLMKTHPERGFFTYYRVDDVKGQAIVLATFLDPKAPKTAKKKDQPYFVVLPFGASGKTFYIGSGEMWRLRTYKEKFHQLFWQNLVRYVSARTSGKSYGQFTMKREWEPGPVEISAEVRDKNFMPLDPKTLLGKDGLKVQIKRLGGGTSDDDKPQNVELKVKHKTAKSDGQFVALANLPGEGRFELRIDIPDTNASFKKEIVVKKKGAEMGDLRTDFPKLQMLASEPTLEMRKRLQERLQAKQPKHEENSPPPTSSASRLFFPLPVADLVTECLVRIEANKDIRKSGQEDIWNAGSLVYLKESWDADLGVFVLTRQKNVMTIATFPINLRWFMLAIPVPVLLITSIVMLIGRRTWAGLGTLAALVVIEAALLLLMANFKPTEFFNPSVLGVLLVVPALTGAVAAGILLMAERYAWVIGLVAGVVVYVLALSCLHWLAGWSPTWFLDPLPVDFVWLLLLLGTVLSLEWFTRKMLRLA
jgi:hypothetical protein